jgi:hypothetical protein
MGCGAGVRSSQLYTLLIILPSSLVFLQFADVEYVGDWPFSIPSLEFSYTKKLSKRESLSLETELSLDGLPSVGLGYTRRVSKGNKLSLSTGFGANGACTIIATCVCRHPRIVLALTR